MHTYIRTCVVTTCIRTHVHVLFPVFSKSDTNIHKNFDLKVNFSNVIRQLVNFIKRLACTYMLLRALMCLFRTYTHVCMQQCGLLMGVMLLVIPFLPASNLLIRVGFVVAERILYIPRSDLLHAFACGIIHTYIRMPVPLYQGQIPCMFTCGIIICQLCNSTAFCLLYVRTKVRSHACMFTYLHCEVICQFPLLSVYAKVRSHFYLCIGNGKGHMPPPPPPLEKDGNWGSLHSRL